MDITSSTGSASVAAGAAAGAIRDTTGSQIISKTLEKLNTSLGSAGPQVDAGYQFQKDVLSAAGIGQSLDAVV